MNNVDKKPVYESETKALEELFQSVVADLKTLGEARIERVLHKVLLDAQGSWLRPQLVFTIAKEKKTPTHAQTKHPRITRNHTHSPRAASWYFLPSFPFHSALKSTPFFRKGARVA